MNIPLKKSVSLFLSLCIAVESIACGGGGYFMDYDMLFDRNILFDRGNAVTTYNAWIYNSKLYNEDSPRIQNSESWANYLENVYRKEDLERFIYRSLDDSFDKTKEQKRLRAKRLNNTDVTQKEAFFLDFIEYALTVEKVVADNTPDPWEETVKELNIADFDDRINEGKTKIKAVQDEFMKERYAYQLLKLYRYSKRLSEAEKIYKTYFSNSTSLLGYWAMEHYAGILMNQKKPFRANYYFIKVYVNCPSKRETSYLSMQLDSEEDFNKTLDLCKLPEERMALHYVRSMQTKALGLEDIQTITRELGDHEYARIIMTHEINKLEKSTLTYGEYDNEQEEQLLEMQVSNYRKELIALNESMLAKDGEDQFWHLSLAYLYYLNGQHKQCSELLETIHPKTVEWQRQHTIIYVVNYLESRQTLTETDENIIGEKLYTLNNNSASYPFLNREDGEPFYDYPEYNTVNEFIFRKIYERSKTKNAFMELIFSGSTIDNLQMEYSFTEDEPVQQSDVAHIDRILNDMQKTPETTLSSYAANYYFRNYEYSRNRELNFDQCEQQLKAVKATFLMRSPEGLQEAVTILSELPKHLQGETIYGDPFAFDIKNPDFNDFYDHYYSLPSMSRYELAQKLNELYKNKSTSMDYYKLGMAYYNTSYYGLQWKAMAYYRSSSAPNGFYSMKVAQLFFKKALAFGKLTKEQEARIYFMLARCEQNEYTLKNGEITAYFNSGNEFTFDTYMRNMQSDGAFSNFEILNRNYRSTQFYDELIDECYYFNYYVN